MVPWSPVFITSFILIKLKVQENACIQVHKHINIVRTLPVKLIFIIDGFDVLLRKTSASRRSGSNRVRVSEHEHTSPLVLNNRSPVLSALNLSNKAHANVFILILANKKIILV